MMTGIEILGIGILVLAGNLVLIPVMDRAAELFGNCVSGLWSGLCTLLDNCCSNIRGLCNGLSNCFSNDCAQVKSEEPALDPTKATAAQLEQRSAANPVDQGEALMDGTKSEQRCNLQRRGAAERKKQLVV